MAIIKVQRFKSTGKFYDEYEVEIPDGLAQWERDTEVGRIYDTSDTDFDWYVPFAEFENGVPRLYTRVDTK